MHKELEVRRQLCQSTKKASIKKITMTLQTQVYICRKDCFNPKLCMLDTNVQGDPNCLFFAVSHISSITTLVQTAFCIYSRLERNT